MPSVIPSYAASRMLVRVRGLTRQNICWRGKRKFFRRTQAGRNDCESSNILREAVAR
jgi:hypothetical protein